MNVTIYSLGDHEIIRAGLNAVAMLFNPANTDLLTGAGAVGLGHAAAFGLLVSMGWIAMRVLLGQQFNPSHMLVILLCYVGLFVPKATVQVEDIYSGQVAVVDDVPIGIALPGGVVSSLAYSVTTKLDQALRLADAETSSLSRDGFVAPLKLILAARGAAVTNEAMTLSLSRYLSDCTDGIPPRAVGAAKSPNFFLDNPFAERMTLVYPQSTSASSDQWVAEGKSCEEAASIIQIQLADLLSGDDFGKYLSQRMDGRRPNAAIGGRWGTNDLQDFIYDLAGAGVDAQNVMLQLATSDIIADTFRCGPLDTSDALNCAASMRSAMESYKSDAAGRAGVFTRTMIPAMNVFMFLFFAVAPLIAVISVMSGMHGITKILPNYMLFGVWTQSWLPVAAIINHFIQRQVKDVASVGILDVDGISLRNGVAFYDLLSTKIAMASDLLAATPIVSFALISGSAMGLTHLANRAADKFDEKSVSPGVSKTGEAVNVGGHDIKQTPFGSVATGASDNPFSLRASSQVSDRIAAGVQAQVGAARALVDGVSERHGHSLSNQISGRMDQVRGAYQDAAGEQSSGLAFHGGQRVANGIVSALSETDRKSVGGDFVQGIAAAFTAGNMEGARRGLKGKALEKFSLQAAGSAAKDMLGRLGAAGKGLSAGFSKTVDAALQKSVANEFSANRDDYNNWSARFASGQRSAQEKKFEQAYTEGWSADYGNELSARNEEAQRVEDTASQTADWARTQGTEISMSPSEIAARSGPQFHANATRALAQRGVGAQQIKNEERDVRRRGLYVGNSTNDQLSRRAVALASLMAKNGMGDQAIGMLLQDDGWDTKNFITPSAQQITGQAAEVSSRAADGAGLTQEQKSNVLAAEQKGRQDGGQASGKAQQVPSQISGIKGQSAGRVTPEAYSGYLANAKAQAEGSGVWQAAVERAQAANLPPQLLSAMSAQRGAWMDQHTFKGMAGEAWDHVKEDPSALALTAAVGAAAAAPALARAATIAAQNGWGAGKEFLGRVLEGVSKRAGPALARAGLRHGATAPLAATGVGTMPAAVINGGLLVLDTVEAVSIVSDAIGDAVSAPGNSTGGAASTAAPNNGQQGNASPTSVANSSTQSQPAADPDAVIRDAQKHQQQQPRNHQPSPPSHRR